MKNKNYIPSLTTMRGVAALMVIIFHFHLLIGALIPYEDHLITKFYLMVDLFFVLSGFVLVHVYSKNLSVDRSWSNYISFIKARFARIYPLHLFTFLLVFGLALFLRSQGIFAQLPVFLKNVMSNDSIPYVLTLTHSWGFVIETVWNIPSWSISVEWFLYLVFPILLLLISKYNKAQFLVIGLISLIILILLVYHFEPIWMHDVLLSRNETTVDPKRPTTTLDITTTWLALIRGLASFILGMMAYYAFKRKAMQGILSKPISFISIVLFIFCGWFKSILPDPITVVLFPFLVLAAVYSKGYIYLLLNNKIGNYLGNISYSIYLVHGVLLFFAVFTLMSGTPSDSMDYAMNWLKLAGFIVITILISSLTYYLVEKPARRIIKRL